jgi:hypothetical protein
MLLLVIDTERRDREQLLVLGPRAQQLLHVLVDVLAIVEHFLDRRARQQTALRPLVHAAYGLVVGVEEIFEVRMERAIPGEQRLQQELLEEPAGVCEVPLRGARVRHALHHVVFDLERLADLARDATHVRIAGGQGLCGTGFWKH